MWSRRFIAFPRVSSCGPGGATASPASRFRPDQHPADVTPITFLRHLAFASSSDDSHVVQMLDDRLTPVITAAVMVPAPWLQNLQHALTQPL